MRIMTVDASLSNTGVCVGELIFPDKVSDEKKLEHFEIMTGSKILRKLPEFMNLEKILDIPKEKQCDKKLAVARKNQRDSIKNDELPSNEDCQAEVLLFSHKIRHQISQLSDIIGEFNPKFIFVEDYSFTTQGSTIIQLAEMKGAFRHMLLNSTPDQLFRFLPLGSCKKIGSRNGAANKEQVCYEMKRFGYEFDPKKENDKADALNMFIAVYFTFFDILYGFDYTSAVKGLKSKEKSQILKYRESILNIARRIGKKDDLWSILKS